MFIPRVPKVPPNPQVVIVRDVQEQNLQQYNIIHTKDEIKGNREKLKGNDLRKHKATIKLSPKQQEIGLGVMLGDASLQTQNKGKTYRLKFEGGNKNQAYIQHLRDEFDEFCLSGIVPKKRPTGITNWAFQTISHVDLQYFATLFLNEQGKKRVPKGLITNTDFTARSLAYWIMDDGGKMDYGPNEGKGMILHTQAFSKEEIDSLCEGLREKWHLQSNN
jgi:hypothetical protein